ncbi:hypothetical protein YC2023_012406 [Brassica napus]
MFGTISINRCARSRRDDLESSDVYINISDAGNLGRLSWQEYQFSSMIYDHYMDGYNNSLLGFTPQMGHNSETSIKNQKSNKLVSIIYD